MKKIILTLAALAALAVGAQVVQVTTRNTVRLTAFSPADTAVILAQLSQITNAAGTQVFGANVYVLPNNMTWNFNGTNSLTIFGM
jgi:hypothetical protein